MAWQFERVRQDSLTLLASAGCAGTVVLTEKLQRAAPFQFGSNVIRFRVRSAGCTTRFARCLLAQAPWSFVESSTAWMIPLRLEHCSPPNTPKQTRVSRAFGRMHYALCALLADASTVVLRGILHCVDDSTSARTLFAPEHAETNSCVACVRQDALRALRVAC